MPYLSEDELLRLGLASCGRDVRISSRASLYRPELISIGDHVRIDDFCVLSAGAGGIVIGSYIHLGVFTSLIGAGRITLEDFVNVSSRVSIYSSNDDYSGTWMTSPVIPSEYTNVSSEHVSVGRHTIIGSGSVILPGVTLGTAVAIGALSLVNRSCDEFGVYGGVPAKRIGDRKRSLLEVERRFLLTLQRMENEP
jgi:dTDP-4-amino-4,6-dideoxy-D-glucose acyltransferase